nr:hypothetical protein [uncultured Brevundimonas sp.]
MLPILAAAGFLSACGNGDVNPPTEPAEPLRTPEAMQPLQTKGPSLLATRGPRSFVGVWAANLNWCSQPDGENRPIRITPMRFEAYQNSCDIASIQETGSGYVATLSCVANGRAVTERLHMSSSGDVLNLVYLDQNRASLKLARCPGSPRPPDESNPLAKVLKSGDDADTPPSDPSTDPSEAPEDASPSSASGTPPASGE